MTLRWGGSNFGIYRRRRWDWVSIGISTLLIAGLIAIITLVVCDEKKKQECRDKGGHVEYYNCHTIITCHQVSCGSNCSTTICTPQEVCDWRCVGLPAEDPR